MSSSSSHHSDQDIGPDEMEDPEPFESEKQGDETGSGIEDEESGDDSSSEVGASVLDDATDSEESSDTDSGRNRRRPQRQNRRPMDRWQTRLNAIEAQRESERRENAKLRKQINILMRQNDCLKNGHPAPKPWQEVLREGGESYNKIYRRCCKQENMSMKVEVTHPYLHIECKEVNSEEMREMCARPTKAERLGCRRFWATILPLVFSRVRPISQRLLTFPRPFRPFPFDKLPTLIQVKILELVLVYPNTYIHCISRLDPVNPPVDFTDEDKPGQNLLLHRFHFGTGPCFIPAAPQPNDILSPLLACKKWLWLGSFMFYGANTFVFSSFGEMTSFFDGIGLVRAERVADIRLMWHGALMTRAKRMNKKALLPWWRRKISQRTAPLTWLRELKRLRHLTIHIQESAKDRIRRRYEIPSQRERREEAEEPRARSGPHSRGPFANQSVTARDDLDEQTRGHANSSTNRSMRTTHGMDYLYRLRGLKSLLFLEWAEPHIPICDWGFIQDIGSLVVLPKRACHAFQSELEQLTPLNGLMDYDPPDYDTCMAYVDDLYQRQEEDSPQACEVEAVSESDSDTEMADEYDEPDFDRRSASGDNIDRGVGHDSDTIVVSDDDDDDDGTGRKLAKDMEPMVISDSESDEGNHTAATTFTRPNYDTQRTTVTPGVLRDVIDLTMDEDVDDNDGDDESEALFVGPGSCSAPPTTVSSRSRKTRVYDGDSSEGLFVPSGSCSAGGMTSYSRDVRGRLVVDLTADDDQDDEEVIKEEVKDEPPSPCSHLPPHVNGATSSPKRPRADVDDGDEDDDDSVASG